MEVPPVKALSLGSYRTVTVITARTIVGLGLYVRGGGGLGLFIARVFNVSEL